MDRNSFELKGWRFESDSGPILSTAERDALSGRLKDACGGVDAPSLPGALFGRNRLELTHEATGRTLSFDADGALTCWARESARNGSGGLRVAMASRASWKQAAEKLEGGNDYDWTFSSDYSGVTSGEAGTKKSLWSEHTGSGLDMDLLRRRDLPIVHYVDIPLYEDDLDDNGESVMRVRLRVMPSCFFLLMRHALRVDGLLIRQHETRVFHKFGTKEVLRVRRLAEAPLEPARKVPDEAAAPSATAAPWAACGSVSHPDEHKAAERLAMLPPKSEVTEELQLM